MKHKITLKRSAVCLTWDSEKHSNLSIVDLAFDHGHFLRAGCRSGYCGTCQTPLIEGKVGYFYEPPPVPADTGAILPCSCFPQSDLEIDI